jgi:cyclopropane fatty-acyl-phospholipid synthase-like methyltransferase
MIMIFEDFSKQKIISYYDKPIYSGSSLDNIRVGWSSEEGQYERFDILTKHVKDGEKILDYGSGLGNMVDYFRKKKFGGIDYLGVDINYDFIIESKERYGDGYFLLIDKYTDVKGSFDWALSSGAFTVHISTNELYNTIDYFYKIVNKGISFNLLSSYRNKEEKTDDTDNVSVRGYDMIKTYNYFKNKYNDIEIEVVDKQHFGKSFIKVVPYKTKYMDMSLRRIFRRNSIPLEFNITIFK